jgi:hypothetical protein
MPEENRSIQIFKLATNKAILDIQDCLNIGKIRVVLVDYSDKSNTKTLSHYVDIPAAKVVLGDILSGRFRSCYKDSRYTEYKGSPKGPDGNPESRVLQIGYFETDRQGRPMNYPYAIKIERGLGRVTDTGAVTMVGKPTESLYIMTSEFDMRRLAVTVLDYVRQYETIYFKQRRKTSEAK